MATTQQMGALMRRSWVEISCDACWRADHYAVGTRNKAIRANGWVITRNGQHFCDDECRQEFKMREANK